MPELKIIILIHSIMVVRSTMLIEKNVKKNLQRHTIKEIKVVSILILRSSANPTDHFRIQFNMLTKIC